MLMKSLTSKDFVKEKFNWQWYYYFLTDQGIEHLREVLHLPAQVFPSTLTKQRPTRPMGGDDDDERGGKCGGKGWGKGFGRGKGGGGKGWEGEYRSSGKGGGGGDAPAAAEE